MDEVSRISADLASLGVREGDLLMVHSSLSSLGHVAGGAESVITAMRNALGPEGTLLMPALSYLIVTPGHPEFDVLSTPSNVGLIPETYRRQDSVIRSIHPTHSVCATGPLAGKITGNHGSDTTPCGPNSPFRLLPEYGGKILMLGCGLLPNTSMHAVEELIEPEYLFGPQIIYRLTLPDGTTVERNYRAHDFCGWLQRYDRVENVMDGKAGFSNGRVLQANCWLIDAPALWETVLPIYRRDPLYFVDRE